MFLESPPPHCVTPFPSHVFDAQSRTSSSCRSFTLCLPYPSFFSSLIVPVSYVHFVEYLRSSGTEVSFIVNICQSPATHLYPSPICLYPTCTLFNFTYDHSFLLFMVSCGRSCSIITDSAIILLLGFPKLLSVTFTSTSKSLP